MNKTKDNFIRSLRILATDFSLVGEEQEIFIEEVMKRFIKEFDLDFSDEKEKE